MNVYFVKTKKLTKQRHDAPIPQRIPYKIRRWWWLGDGSSRSAVTHPRSEALPPLPPVETPPRNSPSSRLCEPSRRASNSQPPCRKSRSAKRAVSLLSFFKTTMMSMPQLNPARLRSYIMRLPVCTRIFILVIVSASLAAIPFAGFRQWAALEPEKVDLTSSMLDFLNLRWTCPYWLPFFDFWRNRRLT